MDLEPFDVKEENSFHLYERLLNTPLKKIGIDVSKIERLENVFIEKLCLIAKQKNLSLYNLNVQDMAVFFLLKCNRFITLFLNEQDFLSNKNPIVKRAFSICK